MTAHGFRTTASSLLNESGEFHPDAIEKALAHEDANAVRKAYNRTQYWDQRVRMMQWWSDEIDSLKQLKPTPQGSLAAKEMTPKMTPVGCGL